MFAVIGVCSIVAGGFAVNAIKRDYNLTVRQGGLLIADKLGVESPLVRKILEPGQRFKDYTFQGGFKKSHPRILFKDPSDIEKIRIRYLTDTAFKKETDRNANHVSAWVCKQDGKAGSSAVHSLLKTTVTLPENQEDFGNGLDMALNYDLLYDHPDWTAEKRNMIETRLHKSIEHALQYLDGGSASLWHGRFQLASSAWAAAAVLDPENSLNRQFQQRAQAHFMEAVNAISLTQGWPEGYNYWINSRAYPFALACLAHINSVDAPALNRQIKTALKEVGLWTIYGTEPKGRFALFGDTGPRNDLKDETQRVIDLIYLGTGDPVFRYYSSYIESLHKTESYYRGYRWSKPLFQGLPETGPPRGEAPVKDLSFLNTDFKKSRIFGKGSFDQVFIRSGWSPHDTFISYRSGDVFTHHGHYKAGHFTLFKEEPLALSSGTYGGFFTSHRLNYYIRTISANALLIVDPGETVAPNRFFEKNVNSGGQRLIIPTGSAVLSVKEWKKHLTKGRKFETGSIVAFDDSNPDYVYIKSDLTPAYGKKAARVTRELIYLHAEDMLIVHDMVASAEPQYLKKWLLHSNYKPRSETEFLLKGKPENGILETADKQLRIPGQKQHLDMAVLLPEKAVIRKIGGPDFKYYVETDGDDRELNGENMLEGATEAPWFDSGLWRTEIFSPDKNTTTEFLVILKPESVDQDYRPADYAAAKHSDHTELQIGRIKLLFFHNNFENPFTFEKKP